MWFTSTVRSILSNEKYKCDALLQKTLTTDFLTKKPKVNEGEVPQYYVTGDHEAIIEPDVWDQLQYELATRHGDINTGKKDLVASRLKRDQSSAWYGQENWASTSPSKHTVWQCNHKYQGETVCQSPTLRDEQIQAAFLDAFNRLTERLHPETRLDEAISQVFDTTRLEAKAARYAQETDSLQHRLEELIRQNQTTIQDQDAYLAEYGQLEAAWQKTLAVKKTIRAQIAASSAKRTAVTAAYRRIASQPIAGFQSFQWDALIDHAAVNTGRITFTFKTGTDITVDI